MMKKFFTAQKHTVRKVLYGANAVNNNNTLVTKQSSCETASFSSPIKSAPTMAALPLLMTTKTAAAVPWYFSYTAPPALASVLGAAPPLIFLGLQLSPAATVRNIIKTKSVGDLSSLPFFTLFTNCCVWVGYGTMVNDMTIIIANGLGVVAAGSYALAYTKYAPFSMTKYYAASAAYLTIPTAAYFSLPIETATTAVGMCGNLIATAFFASPLAVMKTVVHT